MSQALGSAGYMSDYMANNFIGPFLQTMKLRLEIN